MTMGPEPSIRMVLMSSRRGTSPDSLFLPAASGLGLARSPLPGGLAGGLAAFLLGLRLGAGLGGQRLPGRLVGGLFGGLVLRPAPHEAGRQTAALLLLFLFLLLEDR